MLEFKCQRCEECCKRYYIVSLPEEIKKQALFLGETEENFIKNHTQLLLHLFAREYSPDKIVVSSALLPKKINDALDVINGFPLNFFIAVPVLVFNRTENGTCEFYKKGIGCGIYTERPFECIAFPFITNRIITDYEKDYPFCRGLQFKDEKLSYTNMGHLHVKKIASYCESLREKGFTSVWKTWPDKGIVLFEDTLLGEISSEEFLDSIAGLK
ncbi:MAG: YkgJ family cysteine cluster protein [archaeon]|nr:YkgJ family cysteine cluster protein [archaeon]